MHTRRALSTLGSYLGSLPKHFKVHESVVDAVLSSRSAKPVVALESTIVTHGLPSGVNLEVARRCEQVIRDRGAVPATIAVLDGKIHVGLEDSQLQRLADSWEAVKTGYRDLPYVLDGGFVGGTTVSATSFIAATAQLDVFATGGIGGVHREAQTTYDISSDLTTLAHLPNPLGVFCSGAKSILSLPLTLEYLETHSVPVYSFGRNGELPAFYTSNSGLFVQPVSDIEHAARLLAKSRTLLDRKANVFAVPIPEEHEQEGQQIQKYVEQALYEAKEQGIAERGGKAVTPWLLQRVSELSQGRSLVSNEALVINNSDVAAQVAIKYRKHRDDDADVASSTTPSSLNGQLLAAEPNGCKLDAFARPRDHLQTSSRYSTLFFGCAALDVTATSRSRAEGTTGSGKVRLSLGGVARNMAEAAHYVAGVAPVHLIAPLINDGIATFIKNETRRRGMAVENFFLPDGNVTSKPSSSDIVATTPSSPVATLTLDADTNDLITGVVNMDLVEIGLHAEEIATRLAAFPTERNAVGFDANLPIESMIELIEQRSGIISTGCSASASDAARHITLLMHEPTSVAKSSRIIDAIASIANRNAHYPTTSAQKPFVDVVTPNTLELTAMAARGKELGLASNDTLPPSSKSGQDEQIRGVAELALPLLPFFGAIMVTLGPRGVLCVYNKDESVAACDPQLLLVPPYEALPADRILSTTGAGDSFAGALLAELARQNSQSDSERHTTQQARLRTAIQVGNRAAWRSLQSLDAVPQWGSIPGDLRKPHHVEMGAARPCAESTSTIDS